jgi:rsbT antagonist protein RsbS
VPIAKQATGDHVSEISIQKLENLLLVIVPNDLVDTEVSHLRRQVLASIRKHDSRFVLLDFSLVDYCDSYFGRFIQSMAESVELMGAKAIISGLQDSVIETMIEMGLVLPDISTVLDLDEGLVLGRARSHQARSLRELRRPLVSL